MSRPQCRWISSATVAPIKGNELRGAPHLTRLLQVAQQAVVDFEQLVEGGLQFCMADLERLMVTLQFLVRGLRASALASAAKRRSFSLA